MSDMAKTKQPEQPEQPEEPQVQDEPRADPDADLWAAVHTWVARRQYGEAGRVAAALKQWAAAKQP